MGTQTNVLSKQTDIYSQQTQILEQTTQSNLADLLLTKNKDLRYYSFLIVDLDNWTEMEKFSLGILNKGKLLVPFAKVTLESDSFFMDRQSNIWEINELNSLNYPSHNFYLRYKGHNLSVGEYDLTF